MHKKVYIFTDGSCLGNPGKGGYGSIIRFRHHEKKISAGYHYTTNNRMELMAAIVALESLKGNCKVTLSTDSQYVRLGITKWIHGWKQCNWKYSTKNIKNIDLWKRLDFALSDNEVAWEWVKGHSGCPENELCDELAYIAALNPTMDDFGYKSLFSCKKKSEI